jgi:hypothetical protein
MITPQSCYGLAGLERLETYRARRTRIVWDLWAIRSFVIGSRKLVVERYGLAPSSFQEDRGIARLLLMHISCKHSELFWQTAWKGSVEVQQIRVTGRTR